MFWTRKQLFRISLHSRLMSVPIPRLVKAHFADAFRFLRAPGFRESSIGVLAP